MLSAEELAKKVGRLVLFIGTEAYGWSNDDYVKAARNARALGFDTISPKIADGVNKWYGDKTRLLAIKDAVQAVGCGFLPFTYCYGPVFGGDQYAVEAAIAKEVASVCDGLVCLDLEAQWNGQDAAAREFATQLAGTPYDILLTTWADPKEQNWLGVLNALEPVVSAWVPQEYTDWLVNQEAELTGAGVNTGKIFPALDISGYFGGTNPIYDFHMAIERGHGSIWIWEYQTVLADAQLISSFLALLPKAAPTNTPSPTVDKTAPASTVTSTPVTKTTTPTVVPHPVHTSTVVWANYTVHDGDSLSLIASRLNIPNWYADIYVPNKAILDSAARAHGNANCQGGNLIFAGTVIKYPIIKS